MHCLEETKKNFEILNLECNMDALFENMKTTSVAACGSESYVLEHFWLRWFNILCSLF